MSVEWAIEQEKQQDYVEDHEIIAKWNPMTAQRFQTLLTSLLGLSLLI